MIALVIAGINPTVPNIKPFTHENWPGFYDKCQVYPLENISPNEARFFGTMNYGEADAAYEQDFYVSGLRGELAPVPGYS
jgi:hypothetical protein